MTNHAKSALTLALAFLIGAAVATVALRLGPSPSANAPVVQPPVNAPDSAVPTDLSRHTDPGVGLSFSYPGGPEGYVLEELPPTDDARLQVVKHFTLMRAADRVEMMRVTEGREGPPVISIMILRDDAGRDVATWLKSDEIASHFGYAAGTSAPLDTIVGGAHAVAFTSDGLYSSDNVIVTRDGNVYVFAAAWSDAKSPMRADFEDLLRTVEFK